MRGLQYRYSDILPSADDQLESANGGLTDSTNRESVFVVESDIQTEHQRIADELASLFVETELLETGHRIPQRNKVSNYSEIARLFKRGIALLRESDALAFDLSLSRRLYTPVFASVARMMSSGMDDRTRDRLRKAVERGTKINDLIDESGFQFLVDCPRLPSKSIYDCKKDNFRVLLPILANRLRLLTSPVSSPQLNSNPSQISSSLILKKKLLKIK